MDLSVRPEGDETTGEPDETETAAGPEDNGTAGARTRPALARVGRAFPLSLVKVGLTPYVEFTKRMGSNYLTYSYDGAEFRFRYRDFYSFVYQYDCISGGVTRHEGIPLEVLDLGTEFDAILDVGAHFGTYSVILGVLNPGTRLYAFEPSSYNAEILGENVEINGIRGEVREELVSGSDERRKFFEHRSAHMSHTAARPDDPDEYLPTYKDSVAISSVFAEESITDAFLKIDAEGEEVEIITDLLTCADFDRISGILEIHPERIPGSESEVLDLLEANGFTCSTIKMWGKNPGYYFSNFEEPPRT